MVVVVGEDVVVVVVVGCVGGTKLVLGVWVVEVVVGANGEVVEGSVVVVVVVPPATITVVELVPDVGVVVLLEFVFPAVGVVLVDDAASVVVDEMNRISDGKVDPDVDLDVEPAVDPVLLAVSEFSIVAGDSEADSVVAVVEGSAVLASDEMAGEAVWLSETPVSSVSDPSATTVVAEAVSEPFSSWTARTSGPSNPPLVRCASSARNQMLSPNKIMSMGIMRNAHLFGSFPIAKYE